jgi:membrane carboxypeptidase/penicillin-binding protein PbpC
LLSARLAVLPPRVSMAALVVDNATLEVRAYAGSADFADAERASRTSTWCRRPALARLGAQALPLRRWRSTRA